MMNLPVDLDEVARLMADDRQVNQCFLDLDAGAIVLVSTDVLVRTQNGYPLDDLPEWQQREGALCREVLSEPSRYFSIIRVTDDAVLGMMRAFLKEVDKKQAERMLRAALEQDEPIDEFRRQLQSLPWLRVKFFHYEEKARREWAEGWLASLGAALKHQEMAALCQDKEKNPAADDSAEYPLGAQ